MKDKTLPTAEEIRERIKKLLEETWESARSKSHGFQTYDSFFDYYKEIFELDEIIDLINNYVELRLKAIGEEIKEKESITQELLIDELGRPIQRVIGLLQLAMLLLFISSFFVWIWHSWNLAWKIGLSSFFGILILYFVSKVISQTVSELVDAEIKKQTSEKPKSKFQMKMDEMIKKSKSKG